MNAKEVREMLSSSVVLFERPDQLHIDFEEIIWHGTLAGAGVGTKIETLALLLPEPEYIWEDGESLELCYGDISFFIEDERVAEIFIPVDMEDGTIDGGKNAEIEYSLWGDLFQNTLFYFLMVVAEMELDYKLTHESDCSLCVELMNGDTKCYFDRSDEDDCFSLAQITL